MKPRPVGMFREYLNNEENKKSFVGDWYYTGDKAYRDEDGYLWFIGRDDDVIKSSGYRIGPFEVESALIEHPAVQEAAVVGSPDDIRGLIVKAFIILKPGHQSFQTLVSGRSRTMSRKLPLPTNIPVLSSLWRRSQDHLRQDPAQRAPRP
jgi:acetyl-CoA synthetase